MSEMKPYETRAIGGRMRLPFDKHQNFEVRRAMVVANVAFKFGDAFDKNLVSDRRLRQLYDSRYIVMTGFIQSGLRTVKPITPPPMPKFDELTVEGIQQWLRMHDVIPRANSSRDHLIKKAKAKWQELANPKPEQPKIEEPVNGVAVRNGNRSPARGRVQRAAPKRNATKKVSRVSGRKGRSGHLQH